MACNHKFQNYLNLDRLGFEPTTLIVGTFTPAWPADNAAEWFYGRTDYTFFWDILARVYGEHSLIKAGPKEWKQFCHDKQIALTDIIASIDDAEPANKVHNRMLGSFSDNSFIHNFDDFVFVNIVHLLQKHPGIKNVYLTRGVTEAFWKHVWNPVAHYCSTNNIRHRLLLSPTGNATHQHELHNSQNPANRVSTLEDYVLMRWQKEWHFNDA